MYIWCGGGSDTGYRIFDTEDMVTETISKSDFESLESLGIEVVKDFRYDYLHDITLSIVKLNVVGKDDLDIAKFIFVKLQEYSSLKHLEVYKKLYKAPTYFYGFCKYRNGIYVADSASQSGESVCLLYITQFGIFVLDSSIDFTNFASWGVDDRARILKYKKPGSGKVYKMDEKGVVSEMEEYFK